MPDCTPVAYFVQNAQNMRLVYSRVWTGGVGCRVFVPDKNPTPQGASPPGPHRRQIAPNMQNLRFCWLGTREKSAGKITDFADFWPLLPCFLGKIRDFAPKIAEAIFGYFSILKSRRLGGFWAKSQILQPPKNGPKRRLAAARRRAAAAGPSRPRRRGPAPPRPSRGPPPPRMADLASLISAVESSSTAGSLGQVKSSFNSARRARPRPRGLRPRLKRRVSRSCSSSSHGREINFSRVRDSKCQGASPPGPP